MINNVGDSLLLLPLYAIAVLVCYVSQDVGRMWDMSELSGFMQLAEFTRILDVIARYQVFAPFLSS